MARRSRQHGAPRRQSARWWRTLDLRLPTQRELLFLRASLRLAKEVARGYVAALVKHCDRIAKVIRRGRAVSWWEGVLTAGLPEDESVASRRRNNGL